MLFGCRPAPALFRCASGADPHPRGRFRCPHASALSREREKLNRRRLNQETGRRGLVSVFCWMRPAPPRVPRRGWAPFSNRRYRHPRAHPVSRVERSLTPWGSWEAGRHPQAELMPLAVRRDPHRPSVTQHVPELLALRGEVCGLCGEGGCAGIDFFWRSGGNQNSTRTIHLL